MPNHRRIEAIVLFELAYGIDKSSAPARSRTILETFLAADFRTLPFDLDDAQVAGSIRAMLERAGTPIGS